MGYSDKDRLRKAEARGRGICRLYFLLLRNMKSCLTFERYFTQVKTLCAGSNRIEAMDTSLFDREVQVCAKILAGTTTTEIAESLEVSAETILSYRKRLYLKLVVNSQHDLLSWYMKRACRAESLDA